MVRMLQVSGVFAENTYFYIDEETGAGFLIDPGAQPDLIRDIITRQRWRIEKILLTHGHFDHFGAVKRLKEWLGVPVYIHTSDEPYLGDTYLNLSANTQNPIILTDSEPLRDGDFIRLKENTEFCLKVIATPGHTPGSVVYWSQDDNAAFVGDTLYQHGPGLTHFPGGNRHELDRSIRKILALPDDTVLLSGHSSPITVAEEREILGVR